MSPKCSACSLPESCDSHMQRHSLIPWLLEYREACALLSGTLALSLIQGECCLVAKSYNILLIMDWISVLLRVGQCFGRCNLGLIPNKDLNGYENKYNFIDIIEAYWKSSLSKLFWCSEVGL